MNQETANLIGEAATVLEALKGHHSRTDLVQKLREAAEPRHESHWLGYFPTEKDAEAFLNLLMEVLWAGDWGAEVLCAGDWGAGDWDAIFGGDEPAALRPEVSPSARRGSIILGYTIEVQATETQAQAIDLAFQVWRASA